MQKKGFSSRININSQSESHLLVLKMKQESAINPISKNVLKILL